MFQSCQKNILMHPLILIPILFWSANCQLPHIHPQWDSLKGLRNKSSTFSSDNFSIHLSPPTIHSFYAAPLSFPCIPHPHPAVMTRFIWHDTPSIFLSSSSSPLARQTRVWVISFSRSRHASFLVSPFLVE